jgi:NitT/TauT family transport system permease protein
MTQPTRAPGHPRAVPATNDDAGVAPADAGSAGSDRPTPAKPGRRGMAAVRRVSGLQGLAGFGLLLLMLELLSRSGLVHEYYFPPATKVLARTVSLFGDAEFLGHVLATAYATFAGLALAIVVAVPLGVLLGSSRRAYAAAIALIEVVRPVPSVALIPVVILAMGTGLGMKVVLIFIGALWPILFNTIYGIRNVDPVAKDTARAFGCSPLATLARVSLPSASPFAYTGIRIGAAIALILAISAEMLSGAQEGIGVWLLLARETGADPELVFAGTFVAGLVGWLMNTALDGGERRLFRWTRSA